MAEYARILELLDQVQEQLDRVTAEVEQLQAGESDSEVPTGRPRSAVGAPDRAGAGGYNPSKVIPPTQTEDPDSIVGGRRTREFPDCCAVGDETRYFCSGTLIAPNLVVTAKHCTGVRRVFLKGHDVNRPSTGETIRVLKEFAHPNADLRVLQLERNSTVAPRHIAQGAEVRATRALLVGFGNVDFGGSFGYGVKRKVEVPIESLGCGEPGDPARFGCEAGTEMVAGHRGLARDSCTGDSGGPLYIRSAEGDFYLLGATSRGLSNSANACGDGGIYVRVDQFVDWIRTQTGVAIEGRRS